MFSSERLLPSELGCLPSNCRGDTVVMHRQGRLRSTYSSRYLHSRSLQCTLYCPWNEKQDITGQFLRWDIVLAECSCYEPQLSCYSMFETRSTQSANWWFLFHPSYRMIPSISSLHPSSPTVMAAVQYPAFPRSGRRCQLGWVRGSPQQ